MKEMLGILGIVLPALIIILGIIRVFVEQTKGINGLTMLFAVLLLITGLLRYFVFPSSSSSRSNDTKMTPVSVSAHSESFNRSMENILNGYYRMTDGFAANDSVLVNKNARYLQMALDSFRLEELKRDTLIFATAMQPYENTRAGVSGLLVNGSMPEKRMRLNDLSNELQALLSIVRYDKAKIFWMECPQAFGEDKPGNWLSNSETSKNPYGKEDCSETRATINFVPADTTKTTAK